MPTLQERLTSLVQAVGADVKRLDDDKLDASAATPVTQTVNSINPTDEFLLLRAGVPYRVPGSVVGSGVTPAPAPPPEVEFPLAAATPQAGDEVFLWRNGTFYRGVIAPLLPQAQPPVLGLWDHWYTFRLGVTGAASSEFFAGAAISSGTNSTAIPTGGRAGFNSYGALLRSSTTANGGYRYQTSSLVADYFGTISHKFRAQYLWCTAFTNVTVRAGYLDTNTSADATDGAYFEIIGATCSAKTASNSVRTTHPTTITLALDVAYTFDIEVNAAGTEARFRVFSGNNQNTALLDVTITTNIPTTVARAFGAGIVATNSGTTAADLGILYSLSLGTVPGFVRACGNYSVALAAPAPFAPAQWTATAGSGQFTLDLTALPSDGGSAITALRYRINGGAAVTLAGTGAGPRVITGVAGGSEIDLQVQAVNAVGEGTWSDVKSITPTVAPTEPAAFTDPQWTLTAGVESLTLNITALPSNGGSAITELQYRIGTGAAVALTGVGTGSRTISGLPGGTAASVQIRAVNAVGPAAWSDTKTQTPTAGSGGAGPATWQAVELQPPTTLDATTGITAPAPAGTTSSDLLVAIIRGNETVDGLVAPAGWTLIGAEDITFGGLQQSAYWAPGSVTNFNWRTSTGGSSSVVIEVHRISGANMSAPVRAFAYRDADDWVGGPNMPTPSVTAAAGDCIISTYYQPQSDTAVGAAPVGYTQVVNSGTPNRKTTLVRSNVSAGPTGEISHAGNADYQARIGLTLAIASA